MNNENISKHTVKISKEIKMFLQIAFPSFIKIRYARFIKFFSFSILMLTVVILTSAFVPVSKSNCYLTRLEFAKYLDAMMINEHSIDSNNLEVSPFVDLSKKDYPKIRSVIESHIMEGYPDKTFRPMALIRKFEVIFYLKKLLNRSASVKNIFRKRLKKILFPMNYRSDGISSYYRCLLLEPDDKLSTLAKKEFIAPLFSASIEFAIKGMITDSITLKPLREAHLVVNQNSIPISEDGKFSFKLNGKSKVLECFASAEGYKSLSFKRNASYKNRIQIRLRPEQ